MRLKIIIQLFLFCCFLKNAPAQHYFDRYTTENGLSNTTTTSVLQDKKGFLWIGTLDGLNRFDGYNFKVYRNILGDSTSLGCNAIWRMFQSNDGAIWLVTDCGIYVFNPATESFSQPKGFPKGFLNGITEDHYHIIWVAIEGKLYRYDAKTHEAKRMNDNDSDYFTACTVTANNTLCVGTRDGRIGLFDAATNRFSFYPVFNSKVAAANRSIFALCDDGNASLLIGTVHGGVKQFLYREHTYTDLITRNNQGGDLYVKDFCKINAAEIWVATESGIYIYNTVNAQSILLQKEPDNSFSLSNNTVYALCKDREGGIWAATFFGGLNHYSPANAIFEKYVSNKGSNSLKGMGIGDITADKNGNLWIGSGDAGLNKYTPATKEFTHFTATGKKTDIFYANIQTLLPDDNELYIGTFEHGIDVMDLKTKKVTAHYTASKNAHGLKSDYIASIYRLSDTSLLIATADAIYTFNKKKKEFTPLPAFPGNVLYVYISKTSDGTIWASSYLSGIFYYNPQKNIKGKLHIRFKGRDLLENNNTLYLKEAKDGTLWVTSTNGLFHINLKNGSARIYSTTDGLPSNIVYRILEDNQGRYWMPTSRGLALLNKDLKTIQVFNKANGLLEDQFGYSSACHTKDGRIYLGSLQGMISFDPSDIKPDPYKPSLYITNFSLFNIPLKADPRKGPLRQSVLNTDNITLKHDQSSFSIDFAAICFTDPNNVQYAYKMEGFDTSWVYIHANKSVNFTGLPSGKYFFKVRSTNGSGIWQNNERVLQIRILPPVWRTALAYFIYVLLAAVCIFLTARRYRKNLINRQKRKMALYQVQKEKEHYELKIDLFTKLAHEIRTPLSLIKAPLERVTAGTRHLPLMQDYLSIMNKNTHRLLSITNQLLDLRKTEADYSTLNKENLNLTNLTTDILHRFRTAIEEKSISLKLDTNGPDPIVYGDKEALTKIISNLLDNAIKYGKRKVFIQIKPSADEAGSVLFSIGNDGALIPPEYSKKIFEPFFRVKETESITGTGIGLAMARSLAELHKGTLTLDVTEAYNIFILKLPANKEHAANL